MVFATGTQTRAGMSGRPWYHHGVIVLMLRTSAPRGFLLARFGSGESAGRLFSPEFIRD